MSRAVAPETQRHAMDWSKVTSLPRRSTAEARATPDINRGTLDFWRQIDMARPCSDDLREKFVSAYEAGNIALEKLTTPPKPATPSANGIENKS